MAKATPEGKVKKRIKELLVEYGAYSFMPVQNGMGAPTLDFLGMHKGVGFGIEAKAPGKKPTARQEGTIAAMEKAGGKTFVIDGEAGYNELENWLKTTGGIVQCLPNQDS